MFPTLGETLEHLTASRALKFFCMLETTCRAQKQYAGPIVYCLNSVLYQLYNFQALSNFRCTQYKKI